jgi:diguanylate cyclase
LDLTKANQELHKIVRLDSLTNIANRMSANEHLEQEFARYERSKVPYCVMMIDLDHFKRINDLYGHPAGDKTLKDFADLLRSNVRKGDFVARFGGEEFLVILPNTPESEGKLAAENIRMAVQNAVFEQAVKLTISIGIASASASCRNAQKVISEADQALYQAKRSGRNKSISYKHESLTQPWS